MRSGAAAPSVRTQAPPMTFLLLAAGFVLLFLGGEVVVRGAVALARRFGVSPLVIGLTIVGFGTSLPELLVSLEAALSGAPGIAVGNVVGSNIANVLLILGTAALICPIAVNPMAVWRDGAAMVGATVVFIAIGLGGTVDALEGGLMVVALASFVALSLWSDMRSDDAASKLHREEAEELTEVPRRLPAMILSLLLGFAAVGCGADLLVDGATRLARSAGIPEEVIGLTLVAIGTSLPELATSLVAAYRGHSDVCLGNVLGSNMFNLFGILGVTAVATPVPIGPRFATFDLWVLGGVSVLLMPLMISHWRVTRIEGALLLALYAAYVTCQFWGMSGIHVPSHG